MRVDTDYPDPRADKQTPGRVGHSDIVFYGLNYARNQSPMR